MAYTYRVVAGDHLYNGRAYAGGEEFVAERQLKEIPGRLVRVLVKAPRADGETDVKAKTSKG